MIEDKTVDNFDGPVQEAILDFYEIDLTPIAPELETTARSRFANGVNELGKPFVFAKLEYLPLPIEISGVEDSTSGVSPRPILEVSNLDGIIGAAIYRFRGLRKAKVIHLQVLKRHLDAVNFEGGVNPEANPLMYKATIYTIVNATYDYEKASIVLASPVEVEGVVLPLSTILTNNCRFKYRDHRCGYDGHAIADVKGYALEPHELEKDQCGKTLNHCFARFGLESQLPFGAFPMADKTGGR